MDVDEDWSELSSYCLAVDENNDPIIQDEKLVLVNSSNEFVNVEDCDAIRKFYGITSRNESLMTNSLITHFLSKPKASNPQPAITIQPPITHQPPINPKSPISPQSPITPQPPSTSNFQSSATVQNKGNLQRWTNSATLLLLELWRERRGRFENNTERNEIIWEDIANEMMKKKFNFSTSRIENRFKYLKKTYLDCIDHNKNSTGQPQRTCSYFEELDDLFRSSPQIQPPALAASRPLSHNDNVENILPLALDEMIDGNDSGADGSGMESSTRAHQRHRRVSRRGSRMEKAVGRWAEEFQIEARQREEARARRHEELMKILKESNAVYERLTQQLIDKL